MEFLGYISGIIIFIVSGTINIILAVIYFGSRGIKKSDYFKVAKSFAENDLADKNIRLDGYSTSSEKVDLSFEAKKKTVDNYINLYLEKDNGVWKVVSSKLKTLELTRKRDSREKILTAIKNFFIEVPIALLGVLILNLSLIWILFNGQFVEYLGYAGILIITSLISFSYLIISKAKKKIIKSSEFKAAMNHFNGKPELIERIGSNVSIDKEGVMILKSNRKEAFLKFKIKGDKDKATIEARMYEDEYLGWKVVDFKYM